MHKAAGGIFDLAGHFNFGEAPHNFLPHDRQLHLCQAIAHTTVHAIAKRGVLTGIRPVDNKFIGSVDGVFVTVAGDIPHGQAITFLDQLANQLRVLQGRTSHMR